MSERVAVLVAAQAVDSPNHHLHEALPEGQRVKEIVKEIVQYL